MAVVWDLETTLERSENRLRKQQSKKYQNTGLWKTGLITFIAFVIAGFLPLLPYFLGFLGLRFVTEQNQLLLSILSTALTLFFIGSLRTIFTKGRWWMNGFEMLGIGAIAATVAYFLGAIIETFVM
jgi:VIT1/CCC1 family predicted Fe2+/Mn2+ transporter